MPGRSKTWVGRSPPPEEPSPKFQEKALTAPSASVELEPSKRTVWLVQAMMRRAGVGDRRLAHHRGDAVAVDADGQADSRRAR